MHYLEGTQLSLIAEEWDSSEYRSPGDWSLDTDIEREIGGGFNLDLVPRPPLGGISQLDCLELGSIDTGTSPRCLLPNSRLGSSKSDLLPNSRLGSRTCDLLPNPEIELGSRTSDLLPNQPDRSHRPAPESFKIWFGFLEPKPMKNSYYWYWRYRNQEGQFKSLYLAAKLHKAVDRARTIGIPADAPTKYQITKQELIAQWIENNTLTGLSGEPLPT